MSNHVYIEKTMFVDYPSKTETYGFRMYDDYASCYDNYMKKEAFAVATDLDILKYAHKNVTEVGRVMFEWCAETGKTIYVNDTPFTSKDWK